MSNNMDSPSSTLSKSTNYYCKRCSQPLIIHSSIAQMDESALSELSGNLLDIGGHFNQENLSEKDDSEYDTSHSKVSSTSRLDENQSASNSFLIIGDSPADLTSPDNPPGASVEGFAHEMKITSRLFDILSNTSSVDHPLCEECADSVIDKMDQKLKTLEEECKDYREYLENLEKHVRNLNQESNIEQLRQRISELELQEENLIQELAKVEEQRKICENNINAQKKEIDKLVEEKDRFRREQNYLKKTLLECDDERINIDNQKRYVEKHLEVLRTTNVFNATFHIWYNGQFATINGFRLGRLPNQPVEWSEINAAWGQTVLLLYALAKKMNFTFQRYKLVPFGNHSYIETLEDKPKELPLFGSGSFRYMLHNKFDQAMVAFLDCMRQVSSEIEKVDQAWYLPYRMEKEKIENKNYCYSIRIQYNSEEEWTKALKYMLTNLKWILTWVGRSESA